jgi:Inward rectifier potassium channel C-terminal domain
VTEEGEIIPYHPTELKVGVDIEGEVDNILFLWPATVIHKIDEESPFYRLNAQVRHGLGKFEISNESLPLSAVTSTREY